MIVLVGMIATFILAICAYVLFKARERRAPESPVRRTSAAADEARTRDDSSGRPTGWMQPPVVEVVGQRPSEPQDRGGDSAEVRPPSSDSNSANAAPPPDCQATQSDPTTPVSQAAASCLPSPGTQAAPLGTPTSGSQAAPSGTPTPGLQAAHSGHPMPSPQAAPSGAPPSDMMNRAHPDAPPEAPTTVAMEIPPDWSPENAGARMREPIVSPPRSSLKAAVPSHCTDRRHVTSSPVKCETIFWEYTGEGFVPVDPTGDPVSAPPVRRLNSVTAREDKTGEWL